MSMITEEQHSVLSAHASEFEKSYLLEEKGQKHLSAYTKERKEVKQFWNQIKEAKRKGKRITDLVLEKLLPYCNTSHNREKGYRISVAPAITKDIKKWFENAGWQSSDNWDNVANAIYDLVYGLVEDSDWSRLKKFEDNQDLSRGFKAGFLTPIFYCLDSQYRLLNNKTIDTINFIVGSVFIDRSLSNYKENIEKINQVVTELSNTLFEDYDVFDSFCHWMCDKRLGGYARAEITGPEIKEGEELLVEEDPVPQNHWEAIFYIVQAGNMLGYKTYVADPSRKAFDKPLSEIASLSQVPPILNNAPNVARIDAIWFRPNRFPMFLFEVEDGGTMRDALHRLFNAMAFEARFMIVSPVENRAKFEKWVSHEPYREFQERYNFRTYKELFDFYKLTKSFTAMRRKFIKL